MQTLLKPSPQPVNGEDQSSFKDVAQPTDVMISDRSAPVWAKLLSWVFSAVSFSLLGSVAVFSLYFQTLVVDGGQRFIAPLLAAGGTAAMIGFLVFEFAHSRALAGFRRARKSYSQQANAAMGVLILIVLTLVHPAAGLGIGLATIAGIAALWGLSHVRRIETFWDFLPSEATAIFAGRDEIGLRLASEHSCEHTLARAMHFATTGLGTILGFAIASDLSTRVVVEPNAVPTMGILSGMATFVLVGFARSLFQVPVPAGLEPATVDSVNAIENDEDDSGLNVQGLTVIDQGEVLLLSDVSFRIPPGSITGVIGESGAGKSLLMSVLADPFSAFQLHVRGNVRVNGTDPWIKSRQNRQVPIVHVPDNSLVLPASGASNVSCFLDDAVLDQAKRILEQLVFASDMVDEICAASDATVLPGMQRKALSLARAFLLAPSVYLLDRPEDRLPEKQVSAVLERLNSEVRLGRSFLIASDNRAILDACDTLVVLSKGRVVDYGPADEIRARQSAGWARFVGDRSLEIEENLTSWIKSHFKRPGDESNRRIVSIVASEMLAFSCQSRNTTDSNPLQFEFKHFEGHCLVRMLDTSPPISTAQLNRAEQEAKSDEGQTRLSPLAAIFKSSLEVSATVEMNQRSLTAKIATFDPRQPSTVGTNESIKV